MDMNDPGDVLLILSVRPALEEPVVDWLLEWRGEHGFSRVAVEEHSARHDQLSPAEQVRGRQSRLQFQIRVPGDSVEPLLDSARQQFGGADVHYWLLPVLDSGHLGDAPLRT